MVNQSGITSSVYIRGMGVNTPDRVLTNDDLAGMVETSDEWIRSRSGIRERRIAVSGETCSDMAAKAASGAIEDAGLTVADIDLVIVATITPDMPFPATACLVQAKLGIRPVPCFDLEAACSGFLYAMEVARCMLKAGPFRNALVIGAEKLSSILDWEDRSTCVLFGDGAGAVVLSKTDEPETGILDCVMSANGNQSDILYMPGGGSNIPASPHSIAERQHYLKMTGKEVFKFAVRVMEQASRDILKKYNLNPDDISCVIPHQANIRIIESLSSRLGIPMEKFPVNLDRFGNTSAASIPIALEEACRNKQIVRGDTVLLVAFGAGLTWAATLMKWHS